AAERFLVQIGKNAESLSDRRLLIKLPSENDLIIINRFGGNLPEDREEMLITWIKKGGNLIVTADRLWDEKLLKTGNNLLDRYNIRPKIKSEKECDKKSVLELDLELEIGQKRSAKVSFAGNKILIDADDIAEKKYSDKSGNHIVQIRIGQGKLIVLSDNEFLKNKNIEKNDHAYYLTDLAKGRSKIWLVYSNNMPSLLSLLWSNASYFMICFLILLLLCILRLNLKSGPLIPENSNSSRNLMEHLEASGNYLFKLNKGEEMLKKVQQSTERDLKERYLFSIHKTRSEQSSLISKQVNIPAKAVHDALFGNVEDEHDFINKSVILQRLANSYSNSNDYKK
ncbi:MAG: hypothetical protein KAR45_00060, partial [Desulfobacteraceae bacterium]|nr:hypothetical protein [Desulfobacteraceae bacterium]